jgi:hypothetical protein
VRRLVIALTALLAMVGVAVVAAYLLLTAAVGERAAGAVPADSALYLQVYLQPSSGQKLNVLGLIGHLHGFGDDATREEKVHEVTQRLLGELAMNYETDLRPWLGGQVALAVATPESVGAPPRLLLLASVKDAATAREAVPRLMARKGLTYARETYRGTQTLTSAALSYALLGDLLVVANSRDRLRQALDAEADTIPSLADLPAFEAAMRGLPADRLASVYVDLGRVASQAGGRRLGGFGVAALAATAAADGLHLDGTVPFAAAAASEVARSAFALGTRTGSLAGWMSSGTSAEASLFGVEQSLDDLEAEVGTGSFLSPALDLVSQLRLIAGLGAGIDVDHDLLPLFDGEAAVALTELTRTGTHGVLLLRPADPAASQTAVDRMRSALVTRGSAVSTSQAAGVTITSVSVPQIGRLAYAALAGVFVIGLDPADVAAALQAHESGATLARDPRYEPAFGIAGAHAGNEVWADIPALVDAASAIFDPGGDVRDILHQIGELAMSASTVGDHLEVHAVLTVR